MICSGHSYVTTMQMGEEAGRENSSPLPASPDGVCCIHRIPTEILVYLLEIAKAKAEERRGDHKGHPGYDAVEERQALGETASNAVVKRQPLEVTASHVCRYWRDVVLRSPTLWTTLRIDLWPKDHFPVDHDRPPFDRIKAYTDRSSPLPFSIDIRPRDWGIWGKPPLFYNFTELLDILFLHIHRWSTFKVTSCDINFRRELVDHLSKPALPRASQLKTLQLLVPDHGVITYDHSSFLWNNFSATLRAPRLEVVELHILPPRWWHSSAAFSPVTTLSLDCATGDYHISYREILESLALCPSLQKLSIRNVLHLYRVYRDSPSIQTPRVVALPSLTHLVLTGMGESDFDATCYFPLLTLLCSTRQGLDPDNMFHGLKVLELMHTGNIESDPGYLFSRLEQLIRLHIDLDLVASIWLTSLLPSSHPDWDHTQSVYLPYLRTLEVTLTPSPRLVASLADVQRVRSEAGYPLSLVINGAEVVVNPDSEASTGRQQTC
ncbi:hypothetical protein BV22DRAFT_90865 [Leucogyrophana mollusca]|uniref:Uncharacterized protein n=1 Tax=Leucogyrophana mollusca TaxID=85980 RepID=A0ACB8BY83_9AGAM|nr:hypothetical protein BV22DRAFT_90865 [Leucogyrophana mollusca]